ncbi:PREDICTED: receptor-like serine/threonine-protein kinase SD1-8 [Brassica oleracea var. oleracea]|uniref:receptor-like serine/threonine-protein kinase SD1-8 n=1 Tax=Brassica oleracea var. oleracea TaxID=109376 RepID=UPI0006A6C862|nr:PREDICTED: receptor-like serine/threonine-protein kinase SD1-8 [Brassica oleracea var. oleracea]
MISPGNVFELGFFKLAGSNTKEDSERWYLGLWFYKASSKMKPLWVANRETPLYDSKGALKIYKSNLVIVNQSGNIIWSSSNAVVHSPPKASSVVAEILSNGNFVLRYSDNNRGDSFLWESFDYPTDTLLPGSDSAKGVNRSLTSWISNNKPSIGIYSYALLSRNQEMFLLDAKSSPVYRRSFGLKTPYALGKGYLLQVTYDGILQQLSWSPTTREKNLIWHAPRDDCDRFGLICGSNSVCSLEKEDVHEFASCTCFKGFKPRNLWGWLLTDMTEGCQRISRLNCTGNGFQVLKNVKLPDTKDAGVERSIGPKEFLIYLIYEHCKVVNNYTSKWLLVISAKLKRFSGTIKGVIIGGGGTICTVLAFTILWWCWKRMQKPSGATDLLIDGDRTDSYEVVAARVQRIEFLTIAEATNDFCDSNILGKGGFDTVYKGKLVEGTDIAVKRLTRVSDSGTSQFLNEVNLISELQHFNVISLLGYCFHSDEHILVFEYHANRSLDLYIFGSTESSKLSWKIRHKIIKGIARGMTYLHHDSCVTIIHRDLKVSNILLDKDMNPKISDFGISRLVSRDHIQTNTKKVSGTRGYIAPECWSDKIFTKKTDVFSFGVVILEIISGKANYKFTNSKGETSLLTCMWRNWEEESLIEVVDPSIWIHHLHR